MSCILNNILKYAFREKFIRLISQNHNTKICHCELLDINYINLH